MTNTHNRSGNVFPAAVLVAVIVYQAISAISVRPDSFFRADFWSRFSGLESTYRTSQYVDKNPKGWIPDETVNAYAGGAYVRGTSPILIAPDTPPLGRYLIGASALLTGNENAIILISYIGVLAGLFVLGKGIMGSTFWALVPVAVTASEPLYKNQLLYVPLLDIIQLFFLVWALILYVRGMRKNDSDLGYFSGAALLLGCFAATKFFITAIPIAAAWIVLPLLHKNPRKAVRVALALPLSVLVVLGSYAKTLFDGYGIREFLGIQKWVYMYHKSQLILPFTVWPLLMMNRWYVWFGNTPVISDPQWTVVWPLSVVGAAVASVRYFVHRHTPEIAIETVMLFALAYLAFLSLGQTTARYLIILMPFLFILSVFGLKAVLTSTGMGKHLGNMLAVLALGVALGFAAPVPAYADYMLPYPSYMPGNKMYKVMRIVDKAGTYWNFGSIAGTKYRMYLADKYLVEARTLFEYRQYLLAADALARSDAQVGLLPENPPTPVLGDAIREEMAVHVSVLDDLKGRLPASFTWTPEKSAPTELPIGIMIQRSVGIRNHAVRAMRR